VIVAIVMEMREIFQRIKERVRATMKTVQENNETERRTVLIEVVQLRCVNIIFQQRRGTVLLGVEYF